MVSNNDEKYFSRVCIKARLISRIIFIGCNLPVFYSQIKRLKDVQCNNLYHEDDAETNHHEETQFSANYS